MSSKHPAAPWHDWENAAVYASFVREHSLYQDLNRHLVRRARLDTCQRLLDLACGTGATTAAALEHLPAEAEVVGVDGSAPMIEMARAEIGDPRARFRVSPAAQVEAVVSGPFDRVLCNAAFRQFPHPGRVLEALHRLLAPDGLLVFNVPVEHFQPPIDEPVQGGGVPAGDEAGPDPLQVALARAIEVRSEEPRAAAGWMSEARLDGVLGESGFAVVSRERVVEERSQGELLELMHIPAMIARSAPELSADERRAVLGEVTERIDPERRVRVAWLYLVVEPR